MNKKQNKNEFNIEHHIIGLLQDEPFFAALSRRINKYKSSAVPTAGVRVNKTTAQFEMIYFHINIDIFYRM